MTIDDTIAHITDPDGRRYQVLNADGDDWDEDATRALYEAARQTQAAADPT